MVLDKKEQIFAQVEAVQPILVEFRDIKSDEVPNGLPSLRDIQHHIHLVRGASLSNLLHYMLNPGENKILKEKVESCYRIGIFRKVGVRVKYLLCLQYVEG